MRTARISSSSPSGEPICASHICSTRASAAVRSSWECMGLMFITRLRVDLIVLCVGPDETYEPKLTLIIDRHDHSIPVAAHVEYNPAAFENARGSELRLERLRRWVCSLLHVAIQLDQRCFGVDVSWVALPEET